MVDQDDIYLNVKINYPSNPIEDIRTKDLPSLDELKNKIMEKLAIPNTKDYLFLSYKDDKGTVQKIEDNKNIFNYAKEKQKSHQTEYILELDLSISDEVEKFKKFFKEGFDDNKHNIGEKNELDKIRKENEIIKKKIKEMEKSKKKDLEILIEKIKEMKKKIIIKEKYENNKLQIEFLKKELERQKLNNYINELSQKIKEQINIFFQDKIQTFKIEAKKIKDDIIKNQDDAFKNYKAQILNYIKDLKEGMKELNEKNIQLKSTSQKIKKDSEKDKSLNNSSKKGSEQNNLILKEKDGSNSKVINNNKQSDNNNIKMPRDSLRNININNFENKNINLEQFQNDEFYKFLNEFFLIMNI